MFRIMKKDYKKKNRNFLITSTLLHLSSDYSFIQVMEHQNNLIYE